MTDYPHTTAFGTDRFGRGAEKAARFFGTPGYIIGQSIVVVIWIVLNAVAVVQHWDPYPFILLNLAFSTQAAYAAPLILLAQTRQAERDRLQSEQLERHREEVAAIATRREEALERLTSEVRASLEANTALTREIRDRLA
ncbi:MAG: hypothetical protein QOI67_1398 [Gaiellaceae bacterium]|jgi:uncharacterized membrane protein|nr:hypothetical protein [Gaiellaceae bacterium]